MNRIDICKNIIQSIKEYITTPGKLEPHRAKNHFVRKRKLSLFQVIMYLLYTSKASMFQNLSRIREDLGNLDFPDISKQALSKARQFINPALFKELYYLSVDLFYKQLPSRKLWNGYHLFAIDGSKIELPNSKSNFEFFGEMFGYPDPNRRFTMGLGSIVYDVLDDYIVHASFQRYLASERSAALEHLHNLEDLNIYQNSVVIFDRGYYSEDMFRYCVEHQHLCLMRLKQNYNIAKKCSGDIITVLPGNEKDRTEDTKIRVIEVILNDGTKEYLATNLFDSHISQQMFRELYFYRWPVETKYKELKSRLAIEEFSGATTTSVLQEFYINVLLSNLSSLIKNQVDEEIQITAKSTNKYRYQANRAFIIGRIKTIVPKILCNLFDLSVIDRLYKESLRCRSQIMPERTFRRKKNKAIGRTHFNNKKVAF
ncbi:MAG: IS4 family transposase [Lachnospiraceae bacterium]